MPYLVDQQDIQFNLWEYLKADQLTQLEPFKEQSRDMYQMVIDEALKLTLKESDPLYISGDREGCKLVNGKVTTPKGYKEAYQAFAQNGFIGIDVPTDCGGQGLPVLISIVCNEFFIGCNVAMEMYLGLTRGSAHLIYTFGEEKIKNLFCQNMYSGKWAGTMCLTESQAGSAVGDLKTSAEPLSDGTYKITGNKIFISSGDHDLTENIIHLVLARVKGDPEGTKGISLFAVPKIWVNPDGSLENPNDVNCVNIEHKMGIKAQATCSLNFGEKGGCRGFLVGGQSQGMKYMFQMMNEARLMTGMQGQAIAATAYLNTLKYAKERIQGGKNSIINYPDVRRNLTLMKAWVEGMRSMIYLSGFYADISDHHVDKKIKEKAQNRLDLLTPICKAYCSDFGFKVTELGIQVLGGYGYISEYPLEQYMRDTKISSLYEGTNGIQALDLMGRKLTRKNGQLFREFYEDVTEFCQQLDSNPELKEYGVSLKKAADTVGQVAMKFAEWGMGGDYDTPQLGATPFLEICGHVVIAHILLGHALVARQKITEGVTDPFYKNKILTAKYFITEILPLVQAKAKGILSANKAPLEISF